jgi:PAS domain
MKHAASRELYAYWEERRGRRRAPERTEIEPGAIRGALSDAFILCSMRPMAIRYALPVPGYAHCSSVNSAASRSCGFGGG